MELSDAGKKELALALLLWKDFKDDGQADMDMVLQMLELAKHLGIEEQVNKMQAQLPPMKIAPRY